MTALDLFHEMSESLDKISYSVRVLSVIFFFLFFGSVFYFFGILHEIKCFRADLKNYMNNLKGVNNVESK